CPLGSTRGPERRIRSGIASSISASSDGAPVAFTIASRSVVSGPIWRVENCSKSNIIRYFSVPEGPKFCGRRDIFSGRSHPMDQPRPKLPKEAIQLYNQFIHGGISRRAFMDGVQRFAVGGLTAAAVVEALMPNYAAGQQVSKTDDRIKAS